LACQTHLLNVYCVLLKSFLVIYLKKLHYSICILTAPRGNCIYFSLQNKLYYLEDSCYILWQIYTFSLEDVEVSLKSSFTFLAINEFLAYIQLVSIWAHIYKSLYIENFFIVPQSMAHVTEKLIVSLHLLGI